MIAGLSTGRQRSTSPFRPIHLTYRPARHVQLVPGYVYSDQTVKKLMVFPVFSNRLQKKSGGGETFYALANQGKAEDPEWYVEFYRTLPHPGGMHDLA